MQTRRKNEYLGHDRASAEGGNSHRGCNNRDMKRSVHFFLSFFLSFFLLVEMEAKIKMTDEDVYDSRMMCGILFIHPWR